MDETERVARLERSNKVELARISARVEELRLQHQAAAGWRAGFRYGIDAVRSSVVTVAGAAGVYALIGLVMTYLGVATAALVHGQGFLFGCLFSLFLVSCSVPPPGGAPTAPAPADPAAPPPPFSLHLFVCSFFFMFRLIVSAGEARPGPALSPVLGQHQIKPAEFVAEFNRVSAGYTPGTPLNCRVHRVGSTFRLVVCPPTWTTRLGGAVQGRTLHRADLWFALGAGPTPHRVRTALGTLKSLGYRLG